VNQKSKRFKEIYKKFLVKFKEAIKDKYIEDLFNDDKNKRIELKTTHTKDNQESEALTEDIIREMLRECNIDPLDIKRQKVIEGQAIHIFGKGIRRKPDFYIPNKDPNKKGILFEIEHLNKSLEKEGDREGIEQAREWYSVNPGIILKYDSIITNFSEWFILKYDLDNNKFLIQSKEPWEMLEIIMNVSFGRGREYLIEYEEQKQEITNRFYNEFQERLKRLLGKSSKIKINIKVMNYLKPSHLTKEEYEKKLISYYRTIFSRLLFIKILVSWKMLSIDPISIIFKEDKRHWSAEFKDLFFNVFNKKSENRPSYLPKDFKELPYLNGGLFRPSGIELDESGNIRDVSLNSDAILDIWHFFRRYRFIEKDEDFKDNNTINPEILGYIFERSIGDERKKTGSYYTPEEITDYMAKNTIFSYIIEKINSSFKDKILPIQSIDEIDIFKRKIQIEIYKFLLNEILKEIKICDPACGSGAFLKKVGDKLVYLYQKIYNTFGWELPYKNSKIITVDNDPRPFPDLYSLKKYILQHNLYGVDINPSAIEICELRMWLWTVRPPEEEMDSIEYIKVPSLPNIEYNIRCGDSLIGYYDIERISTLGKEKFQRLDEKFIRKNLSISEILSQKENLIHCYYKKDETTEEDKKNEVRKNIDNFILYFKDQLNHLLLSDYQNQELIIPITPINISTYINEKKFRIILQDLIRELNINYSLIYFKINYNSPVTIDSKNIRTIEGITCSLKKKSNRVTSIYPTSKFNFSYYHEHGDKPLSKFIISLISNWNEVRNIEFRKKIDINDIESTNPFHWVMEFSEIFNRVSIDERGFDIIIGNPPYITMTSIEDSLKHIFDKIFNCFHANGDIYYLFLEHMFSLLSNKGSLSLIVPRYFMKAPTAIELRKYLANKKCRFISDFGENNIFKNGIHTLILFFLNYKASNKYKSNYLLHKKVEKILPGKNLEKKIEFEQELLEEDIWNFTTKEEYKYIRTIKSNAHLFLDDVCILSKGIQTGKDSIFVISEKFRQKSNIESEVLKLWLKNGEIDKFFIEDREKKYVIYSNIFTGDSIKSHINVYNYLLSNKNILENRSRVNRWYQWRKGDERSTISWDLPKIVTPYKNSVCQFALDSEGYYFSQDVVLIQPKNKYKKYLNYFLALLNSKIILKFVHNEFKELKFKIYEFYPNQLAKIPIILPSDEQLNAINNLIEKIYREKKYDKLLEDIDNLIKKIYS